MCPRGLHREKILLSERNLKRGNQILIPLHMRVLLLERIDHRHRILIECRERCRDAIWWSNFSQAVKRNVFSLQEAQTPGALWASHRSTIGRAPTIKAGKLLWWLKTSPEFRSHQFQNFSSLFAMQMMWRHLGPETASTWGWHQQGIVLMCENCFFVCVFSGSTRNVLWFQDMSTLLCSWFPKPVKALKHKTQFLLKMTWLIAMSYTSHYQAQFLPKGVQNNEWFNHFSQASHYPEMFSLGAVWK